MSLSFEEACTALAERLKDGAYDHSVRVAHTAADLASKYGVDVERARLAGLLHDWDRSASHEELLAAAERHGIEVGETERNVPYLLHALTGAAALHDAFPTLDPEVLDAIERHTVGAPEMTDLDKVVYLADMLEPGRSYEGVDELRAAVGEVPLGELFARGYEQSLMHLVRSRKWIHPVTLEVWNGLANGGRRD